MYSSKYENQLPSESVANPCPYCPEGLDYSESMDRYDCPGCGSVWYGDDDLQSDRDLVAECGSGI